MSQEELNLDRYALMANTISTKQASMFSKMRDNTNTTRREDEDKMKRNSNLKPQSKNVFERKYLEYKVLENKRKSREIERLENEVKDCTFQPGSKNKPRNLSKFLSDQQVSHCDATVFIQTVVSAVIVLSF